MKPKTMVLMVIAVACGLGASYMTSQLLADRGQAQQELPKVPILVAKKQIEMSTPLKNAKDLFEIKMLTAGEEPKNAVKDLEAVKELYIKSTLRKGHYLLTDDLTDVRTQLQVPEGFRAVGVRVNAENIAGGFAALPGSRVDLIYNVRRNNDDDTHSGILLEDVLVLAADTESRRPEDRGAIPASVVTVALKPKDALKVDLAMSQGSLRLVLRGPGDKSLADTDKVNMNVMLHGKNKDEVQKGKTDLVEAGPGGVPATAQVPVVPAITEPRAVEASQPKQRKHAVVFQEGVNRRRQLFLLNEAGEVVVDDINQDGESGEVNLPLPPRNEPNRPAPQVRPNSGPAAIAPRTTPKGGA